MADSKDIDYKKAAPIIRTLIGFVLRIIAVLLLVIAFHYVIGRSYDFGYGLFAAPAVSTPPGREVSFVIEKGESTSDIIDALAGKGLIRDRLTFLGQIFFYDKDLMPGEYTLNTSMTSKEILMELNKGPSE